MIADVFLDDATTVHKDAVLRLHDISDRRKSKKTLANGTIKCMVYEN